MKRMRNLRGGIVNMVNQDEHLSDLVLGLIRSCREDDWWDFKEKHHADRASLLHDIICLANNRANRDGYLIIGVRDKTFDVVGVENDLKRRNQQNITDFLRNPFFVGQTRPRVEVYTVNILKHEIDILIIKNTTDTPYYLIKDYSDKIFEKEQGKCGKTVRAYHIYTRVVDTNTPIDQSADINAVEYLWRKRFGLDLLPLEKVKLLLSDPKDWYPIGADGQHSNSNYLGQYYHKQFPEFTLSYNLCRERFADGRINTVEQEMYWMNKLTMPLHNAFIYTVDVKYHSTVLYSTLAVFADNFRFQRVLWKNATLFQNNSNVYISYCYIEKDSLDFMLDNWLCNLQETIPKIECHSTANSLEPWILQSEYRAYNPYSVVPVFKNSTEHKAYQSFVKSHQEEFLSIIGEYSFKNSPYKDSCAQCDAPDYIEYLCKSGENLVQWLDRWRAEIYSN